MRSVFLDLDGTLTDPKPGITGAFGHALRSLGLEDPGADALEWVIGPPLIESFTKLGVEEPQKALDLYRADYIANGLFDAEVYSGILTALNRINAAGHRMFLMTAKPHAYATTITEHFGLDRHLERQYGPELDGTRNSKAELLAYALDQLGMAGRDAVMVGDRSNDLNAARANDMPIIGVTWGYAIGDELSTADVLCHQPSDLPGLISALGT